MALRTEGHREAVVAVGTAIVGPAVAVGCDLQRGVDLLDGGGSCGLAALGVGHRQGVVAVGQVVEAVAACSRLGSVVKRRASQRDRVVSHTVGDGVVNEAVGRIVAVAGRGINRQSKSCRHIDVHCHRILVTAEVFHIDFHRQRLREGSHRNGGSSNRALRHHKVGIGRAVVGGNTLHAGSKVRIAVLAGRRQHGRKIRVIASSDGRLGLVAALESDGVAHRIAAVGDGVFALDFPVAVICLDLGLHRIHLQGHTAGGGVEGLHGILRREGGSASVASVHIRLVARPGARQSRGGRSLDSSILGSAHLTIVVVLHGEFQFFGITAARSHSRAGVGGGSDGSRGGRHRQARGGRAPRVDVRSGSLTRNIALDIKVRVRAHIGDIVDGDGGNFVHRNICISIRSSVGELILHLKSHVL